MIKKHITYCLLFFIPVIVWYLTFEYLTLNLPNQFIENVNYIEKNKTNFEVLALGSSQLMSALNPALIDKPTLNLASGNQHHDTDFKLLKAFKKRFPNLKTIILEVSYSHFELPYNTKSFWKNNIYLKYYNVNCFERNVYFKDRLIYLSNPSFFRNKLYNYYIKKNDSTRYNEVAFTITDSYGQFAKLNYNEEKINNTKRFKINTIPNLTLYSNNSDHFIKILDFAKSEDLKVVVVCVPMYKTYLQKRNPEILNRRNILLSSLDERYNNVFIVSKEEDTTNYGIKDYYNQSHLSYFGAQKFSKFLNAYLNQL